MDKQQLLETITNLNQVDKISLEELQHLASSYPYFQTAHLLLAYKTQKIMHAEHSSVLSRAATVVQNREILFRLLHPTLLNSNTISDLENKPFEPPILDEHEDATIAISPVIIPTTPNFIPDEELPLTALHLHASASTEQTAEQLEQEIEVLVQKFGANPPATITLNDDEPEVKSNDLMVQTENNNQSSNTTEPTPIIPELNNDSSLEFINTINDDDVDENLNIADIAKQALTELQAVLSNNINHRNIEEVSTDTEEAEENTDFVALHTEAISKEALAELQVELSNNKTEEEEEQVQLANEVNPPDIEEENTDSVALHTEAISKEALAELQVELSNNKTEEEEEEQVQLANEVNPPDIEEENTDSVALHTEAISKEALAELQVELSNNPTEEEEEQVQSANEVNPPDIEEENTDSVALHTEAISKEALAELQVELSNNQTEEEEEQVQSANEVNPPDIEEENTDSVALHTEAISKEALAELQVELSNNQTEEEEQVQSANEVNPPDIEEENTDSVALHTEAISKEALAELQVELSNNQTEEEEEEEQVQLANEVNPPDIEEENTDSVALHTEAISKEALAELQVELSNNQTEEEEEEEQVQLANEVNPPDIEEENTDSVALHTEAISKEALAELQAYLLNTTENESANLPVEPVPNNEAIEAAAQKSLEEDPDLLLALQQKIANYKQVLHMQANPVKTDEPNSIENEENMEEADLSPTGIVTERLAKVYARQGYYDEAIKIYKQLILKFPEKRRYFAVRIEELRNKLV